MKFVSNIGWIHKYPTELRIDILNVENLTISIPIASVKAVMDGFSGKEHVFDNRGEVIGKVYLSPYGGALYLDIYYNGKTTSYSTPISLINKVLSDSIRKPISQIVDRDRTNNMPSHGYYSFLCKRLSITGNNREIQNSLEAYRDEAVGLISRYHEGDTSSIDYNDRKMQIAYMLCYFPWYIENVFQTLSFIDPEHLRDIFRGHLKVNLYGCGPAPDFLGLLAYVNRHFRGETSTIEPYFFERVDWGYWRTFCLEELAPNYCDGIAVFPHQCSFNLLECDKVEYLKSFPSIMDSKLHIFQNCATELLQATGDIDDVLNIFLNFTELMKSGSILLINDFIGRGDSLKILLKYEKKLLEMADMTLLDPEYNVDEYAPNITRCLPVTNAVSRWYRAVEIEPRKVVGFSYCVAKKN